MVKTLDAVSNLVPLYAKAAAGSAEKRPNSIEIKVDELTVNGVTVDADRDQDFHDAAGAPKSKQAFFGHIHALIMPIQVESMAADDFPLLMMGLVYTENTYREISPVTFGGKVDTSVKVTAFRAYHSGTEVVLESTVTSPTFGATLVGEQSVYLAKSVRLKDAEGFEEVQVQRETIKSGVETIEREQFRVPFPIAQWKLTGNTGCKWIKVSGDQNLIHITSVSAKALDMPAAIAYGMYTALRAPTEAQVLSGQSYKFQTSSGAPVVLLTTINVTLTHTGDDTGVAYNLTDSSSNIGHAVNIVAWDRKKKRPHLTRSVRPLK